MADDISFAMEVKEEISSLYYEAACRRALLSGFAKCNGSFHIGPAGDELDLSTESSKIAKLLYNCVSSLYGVKIRFSYTRGMGFRKRMKYHVLISEPDDVLSDIEVDFFQQKVPTSVVKTEDQAAAYLAGAFLASGSVNDPSSSNYHLEIAVNDGSYAKWLSHLLNKSKNRHFDSKVAQRRKQFIVYLKRSDQISEFLVLVKANESCLKFENVRVERDFANIGNRLQNLDGANMSKTLKAAERQHKEIEYFVSKDGLDSVDNPKLRGLMELRLDHPDASLDELAMMLSEKLGMTISKSNVNHRFRGLHEAYLKENPNEKE